LNNIGLFLGNVIDTIEMGRIEPQHILKSLRESMEQVRKASEIIAHLRIFGRGETLARKLCPLHRVIHEALSLLQQQLRLRQIDVDLDLAPGEPMVLGNAIQLEQVFLNLLTNARDALTHAQDRKIRLRTVQDGDYIEVHIADTGPGIPAGLEHRIFDPFFTTKDVGQGTGLGLSISYSIVKAHHGGITVVSPPGSGALFVIRLPLGGQAIAPEALAS
jgi:signal transduction histidine kinase